MKLKNNVLLAFFFLSILAACNSEAQQTELPVAEFEKAISQEHIQVLDVRTPGEYQSGHLEHSFLADWNNEEEFQKRVSALDKSQPVYTYCLSGARSNAATKWLRQNGFTAYNLTGGINAWKKAGKPLEQATSVKQISMLDYMAKIPQDKTVLVDFSAEWCPPCKKMEPILDSLTKTNGSQFILVKIDAGEQIEISKILKVDGFPTFILYKQGKEIWRKEGIVEAKEIVSHF